MSKKFCWVVTHTADDEKSCTVGQGAFDRDIPTARAALEFAAALPASFRVFNEKEVTLLQGKCDVLPPFEDIRIGEPLPLEIGGEFAKGIEFTMPGGSYVFMYEAFGKQASA